MEFEYRVKGKVTSGCIIRGRHFGVGQEIDFCAYEKELDFIKDHFEITNIVDLQATPSEPLAPVLEPNNLENKKGVQNGTTRSNKKHKTNR